MIKEVLYSQEQLNKRVIEIAGDINKYFNEQPVLVISVLKGAVFFAVDLMKHLEFDTTIDFICASSYGSSTVSSGEVTVKLDIELPVEGKNVLIIEDIIDTGITLSNISETIKSRGAKDVKVVALFNKPERRIIDFHADFIGFDIADEFIVGYGLDYNEQYRNLPYIGILDLELDESEEQK